MRIAVIGTGNIGGVIGRACAGAGHTVVFGSRKPVDGDVTGGSGATVTGIPEALAGAAVVVLALPGTAVAGFVEEHADDLSGTLVVDATNKVGGDGPANSYDTVTATVPDARYARAFNTLGFENLADPQFGATTADMFFSAAAGDRGTVETLIEAVGLRPVYVGDGAQEVVDGLLRLWFALAIGQERGRNLAFKMLER
jgi:8-hydroxy-5-deazaflavin:NADPH oxidoreductase